MLVGDLDPPPVAHREPVARFNRGLAEHRRRLGSNPAMAIPGPHLESRAPLEEIVYTLPPIGRVDVSPFATTFSYPVPGDHPGLAVGGAGVHQRDVLGVEHPAVELVPRRVPMVQLVPRDEPAPQLPTGRRAVGEVAVEHVGAAALRLAGDEDSAVLRVADRLGGEVSRHRLGLSRA